MIKSAQKYLDAIKRGEVTRGNILGLRKLINASERKARGLPISATSAAVDMDELDTIESAIALHCPLVTGDLHESGLAVLRNPRYKNRLQDYVHEADIKNFRLVRFDRIGRSGMNCVPVYQVWAAIPPKGDAMDEGSYLAFNFRNIPWQSGGEGPEILEN